MTVQDQFDAAIFDFSGGDFAGAVAQLRAVLARDPACFDAQHALGMAYYRLGDTAAAIAEGKKAFQMRPQDQLVHTNLSLFYQKAGDKPAAEHHALQARIAGWRAENRAARSKPSGDPAPTDSELPMARPQPPAARPVRPPTRLPEQPWRKKADG